jgi:TolA-binding protein
MKQLMALAVSLALSAYALAAPAPKGAAAAAATATTKTTNGQASRTTESSDVLQRLDRMQQALDAQQEQISRLKDQLQERDAVIQKLQETSPVQATGETTPRTDASGRHDFAAPKTFSADDVAAGSGSLTANLSSPVTSTTAVPAVATAPVPPPPAEDKDKLSDLAYGKVKLGATFYGNFSHYTDAGYAPAFQDLPTTQLPPGNSGLNVFEVTRAYLNLFYTPSDEVTLRVTPDIYRGSDGSLVFRLKYAYVDFQKIFGDGAFKKAKLTFGQTQQPLTDWEEGLSGYRYAYLTPWNYLSLSSTYTGVKLHGPIEMNGKEYLDYDLGVFTTASFHAIETNDKKQAMGRLTFYPFGTTADRTGLGFTVFENYGYNTKLPSQISTPLNRLALIGFYQTHDKADQIAFEYQLGRNATSTGNIFSGDAPPSGDAFGTLAGTVLSGTSTRQQGFDVYGHARLGHSPFSLWGLFQDFQPNTHFQPASVGLTDDPLDFERTVGGIAYKVTNHFDFAFGDQNFHWKHPQGVVEGGDTNAIVIWTQFNY